MNNSIDYLTQSKLSDILSKYYDIHTEAKIAGTRYRSDIQFEKDGKKYAVEFEGDSHYCNTDVIERDRKKDTILTGLGFECIHIPYWIQISTYTFKMFFDFPYPEDLPQVYPHGFIDPAAKLPVHYCVNGIFKFNCILSEPAERHTEIFVDVIKSLVEHPNITKMDNLIPMYYGADTLKSLIEYLKIGATKETKKIYNKFLDLSLERMPTFCVRNSIPRN